MHVVLFTMYLIFLCSIIRIKVYFAAVLGPGKDLSKGALVVSLAFWSIFLSRVNTAFST